MDEILERYLMYITFHYVYVYKKYYTYLRDLIIIRL